MLIKTALIKVPVIPNSIATRTQAKVIMINMTLDRASGRIITLLQSPVTFQHVQ